MDCSVSLYLVFWDTAYEHPSVTSVQTCAPSAVSSRSLIFALKLHLPVIRVRGQNLPHWPETVDRNTVTFSGSCAVT